MILATYQHIDFEDVSISDKYNEFEEILGYKPIFCFAANTLRQCIVESILAAPHRMHQLIIFETDDYDMIDIVKYNKLRESDGSYNIDNVKDCITTEPKINCREYLVRCIKPESVKLRINVIEASLSYNDNFNDYYDDIVFGKFPLYGITSVGNLKANIYSASDALLLCGMINSYAKHIFESAQNSLINDGDKLCNLLSKHYSNFTEECYQEWLKEDRYTFDRNCYLKRNFQQYILPFILHISGLYSNGEYIKVCDLANCCAFNYADICEELASVYDMRDDANGKNHTYEAYDALYERLLRLTSGNMIEPYAKMMKKTISRNCECPCGSGIKYKKCHGKSISLSEMNAEISKSMRLM